MSKGSTVLITGGSGLVGSRLTELLTQEGYTVTHLSRSKKQTGAVKVYQWDLDKKVVDEAAISDADYIIHLAGSNLAGSRWTAEKKMEIISSRVDSTAVLRDALLNTKHQVRAFVSASAIGIYGADTGSRVVTESSPQGKDFVSKVSQLWEGEVDKLYKEVDDIRVVKLRIGIVLSDKGGALPKMVAPIKLGVGAPLGSGDQCMSWIHIDDLCRMFIHALQHDTMSGAYNAVGPQPATNEEITREAAKVLGRPLWLPAVPSFALKLALGEMASIVTGGSQVSNDKIKATGFTYQYPELHGAIQDLYG